jgi:hypothetical protein
MAREIAKTPGSQKVQHFFSRARTSNHGSIIIDGKVNGGSTAGLTAAPPRWADGAGYPERGHCLDGYDGRLPFGGR